MGCFLPIYVHVLLMARPRDSSWDLEGTRLTKVFLTVCVLSCLFPCGISLSSRQCEWILIVLETSLGHFFTEFSWDPLAVGAGGGLWVQSQFLFADSEERQHCLSRQLTKK